MAKFEASEQEVTDENYTHETITNRLNLWAYSY
jgi:hypothetical protein